MNIKKEYKEYIKFDDGRKISIETGKLAKQADGSVIVRMGDTMLLATVVIEKEIKEINYNYDFLPLTVDYREKYYSVGKIPGGFIKREGRPSDEEILTMRLVDRVLRPLFPKNFYQEIQIMIFLLSYDKNVLPDSLACLAASTALTISGIPFNGPVSSIRIIKIKNNFIINPGIEDIKKSEMDLIIGANKKSIIMIEGEMKEIHEDDFINAIKIAHKNIKNQIKAQNNLFNNYSFSLSKYNRKKINEIFIKKKEKVNEKKIIKKKIFSFEKKIYYIFKNFKSKKDRYYECKKILEKIKNFFSEDFLSKNENIINYYFNKIKKIILRKMIINENIRLDGRKNNQIRKIESEVDFLPGVHGSALFTRGETQALSTVTLGSSIDVNKIDNAIIEKQEKFYLHYNFNPFSTGEVKKIMSVSRREIGHGNLAKRSLKNIIPDNNPYTIRIVSDVLESNGSSSMATVCASTLALMDAGINIKNPVSGISMGIIIDNKKYVILSDITGEEDRFGDMDFKISGTKNGITACQMDVKVEGINYDILNEILKQSNKERLFILEKMLKILPKYRKKIKPNAPKIFIIKIPKNFIGLVIGQGGKNIQEIQSSTNTSINIEEKNNKGIIEIIGKDEKKIKKAIEKIKKITFIPKIGEIYNAEVKCIKDYGAFLEISKGIEGFIHISEIDNKRIKKIQDVLKIGDKIKVKLIHIDSKNGKIKFSRKIILNLKK